ncbi:hypothetical protein D3C74_232070 [compost metagenome]
MAKITLALDGTQMIETLKEAAVLMDEIIVKAERLQSIFSNNINVDVIVSRISETLDKEMESASMVYK